MNKQVLIENERSFKERAEQLFPGMLRDFPIASYLSKLQVRDPYLHYEDFSPVLIHMLHRIKTDYGQEAVALYHKMGLAQLIISKLDNLDNEKFTPAIRQNYISYFERIIKDFSTQPDSYYDINRPLWPLRKDIGVCSGRSIPVGGAWVIERRFLARRSMISRSRRHELAQPSQVSISFGALRKPLLRVLWKLRLDQTARRVGHSIRRLRADYDLCYVIHTVERNIRDFRPEKMNLAYQNVAKLLENDSHAWGIFRSSWFLDPALNEISPSMGFLLQVPMNNGAVLYSGDSCSAEEIRQATFLSAERNRLYAEGTYLPKVYFYFWSRQQIIEAFGQD